MSIKYLLMYLTTLHLVYKSASLTISSMQIKDSAIPVKGSKIQLVCSISGFTSSTVVSLYKTDIQTIAAGERNMVKCVASTCIDAVAGYTYAADARNIYVTITDLSQTTDGKWWTCRYRTQTKALQLVVYNTVDMSNVKEAAEVLRQAADALATALSTSTAPSTSSTHLTPSTSTASPASLQSRLQGIFGPYRGRSNRGRTRARAEQASFWSHRFVALAAVPRSLLYDRVPSDSQDLSINSVSLECKSSCAYPAPNFVWYYSEVGGSRQQYSTSAVAGEETDSTCTDTEKLYTSTLTLPRYTTFTGYADRTVKLECGIPTFPGRDTALYTPLSPDITFAVKTMSVTLRDGSSQPTSSSVITVTSGSTKTLTCSPSLSRPAATLVWYIGNVEKQRSSSTSFTFTPSNNDHDKQVYCKAFSIPPESQSVFSQRPKLYVQVQALSVALSPILNKKIEVTSGLEKTLTCTPGTSRPSVTIVWYIGTTKQSTTGTSFSFTPTNNDRDKTVYCKAYNIQPEEQAVSSATPSLYVRVLATTPTLVNQTTPGNLILLSGDDVKLVCTSSVTRPAATVTWKKGTTSLGSGEVTQSRTTGNLVSVTSVLTITPVNGDNNQVIRCETTVSGQANTPSAHETIDVWWSPSTISIQPNLPLPWFDDHTGNYLTCASSNYGNPASTTNWISQYGTPDDATRRLSFPQLSHVYDTMDVICELSNGYTQRKGVRIISPTVNLDVQYKPIVNIKRNNAIVDSVTLNEGQSLSVSCTALGNPDPIVWWTSTPTGGGLLQFTDIDRKDDDSYICRASATSTRYPSYSFVTEKSINVTVNFAPEVTADLSTSSLEENSSVNITCSAAGRPTTYTYADLVQTWRDTVIPNTHSHMTGTERYRSLALTSLQLQDTGNYTCHVNNGIKDRTGKLNQTGNVYLKVKVSPNILPIQENFAGGPGDTVNIHIPFYSYPAAVGVTFVKQGGGPIQNGNRHTVSYPPTAVLTTFYGQDVILDGNTAILQITALRVEDFANYTLTIINSIGTEVHMYSLNSQSKPLPPKPFVYLGLFDGVPQFYWEQGFNGGHVQFFIIETTIVGTNNWMKHEAVEEGDQLYQQANKSYIANITGLAQGQYSARLTAENKLGSVEVSDRPTVTFTIPETRIQACACSKVNNTAEIIGAFVGGIALTVMILAAIFIVRRQRQLGKSNTNGQHVEDASKDQHVYYNMSATGQTTEDITLKESDSDTDTATYETTISSNPSEHLYTDLKAAQQGANKPHTNMEMYENLKLQTSR